MSGGTHLLSITIALPYQVEVFLWACLHFFVSEMERSKRLLIEELQVGHGLKRA